MRIIGDRSSISEIPAVARSSLRRIRGDLFVGATMRPQSPSWHLNKEDLVRQVSEPVRFCLPNKNNATLIGLEPLNRRSLRADSAEFDPRRSTTIVPAIQIQKSTRTPTFSMRPSAVAVGRCQVGPYVVLTPSTGEALSRLKTSTIGSTRFLPGPPIRARSPRPRSTARRG